MNTRKLTMAAVLTALSILIPFVVFFKVIIPPFTATLGSHVPMFISMFLGPEIAILVGLGSALGFFISLGLPVVGARAFMHVFVGLIGAILIKKGMSFGKVAAITAPIHGLLEVLVVIPFGFSNAYHLLVVTGVGSILHHCADAVIAFVVIKLVQKSGTINLLKVAKES